MNKSVFRTVIFYAILAGSFLLVDLLVDRLFGGSAEPELPHLLYAVLAVLVSYSLMNRAMATRRQAEVLLRQARDELEVRVEQRTTDLQHMNQTLQAEITERHQAEEERERSLTEAKNARLNAEALAGELQMANSMLHVLIETLPAGMVIIDLDGGIVLANPLARAIMGNTLAGVTYSLEGDPHFCQMDGSMFPPEELPLKRALQQGETTTGLEAVLNRAEGGRNYILIAASPIRDDTNRIISAVEIVQDITALKQMQQDLRASEETASALMNALSESAVLVDSQGIVQAANETSARRLGTTPERMVGFSLFDAYSPEVADRRRTYLEQVLRTCQPTHFIDERDGRMYDISIQPVLDADGSIIRLAVFGQDITEQRQAEQALRASELKFSTVFQFSPDAIGIIRTSDGNFLDVNDAFAKMWGGSRSDIIGNSWMELNLIPAEEVRSKVTELFRSTKKIADYELSFTNIEGSIATMLVSLITIMVNEEACVLVIAHDITERKQSEVALHLVQAELEQGNQDRIALEERQRLARELHDSVSQALYGISLGAHTAITLFDSDRTRVLEALNYVLSLAQAGLTEMRALIFELRPESLEMEGLVTALTKQTAALRARHGFEVELSVCAEPDVPIQIKEALYRIAQEALQNAVKHARPNHMDVRLVCSANSIGLEICDNGIGFDAMAVYPGHLGLLSMRERAVRVGGTLEIVSAPNCGTQIRVQIPI